MEWDEYKEICDHPSVLTRWLLEQTLRVCDPERARLIASTLGSPPIEKPMGHKGGTATDMFNTSLKRGDVVQITQQVHEAVETEQKTKGPVERDYSHIEKTWLEYLHWCDELADPESQTSCNDPST